MDYIHTIEYLHIKLPWFGDIRMQLNRTVGIRYVLIKQVVSAHPLISVAQ